MQIQSSAPVLTRSFLVFSIGMFATCSAFADHRHHGRDVVYETEIRYEQQEREDYGRVIDARPIYESVAVDVPGESCHVETVARDEGHRGGDSFAGTVVGGLIGAAIGHEVGHGRGGATAVGGLVGASIGNDASKGARVVSYRDQEVCDTRYHTEYENRIVGYDVSYSYEGHIYQTRTKRHPGDRIAVAVDVHPSYRD